MFIFSALASANWARCTTAATKWNRVCKKEFYVVKRCVREKMVWKKASEGISAGECVFLAFCWMDKFLSSLYTKPTISPTFTPSLFYCEMCCTNKFTSWTFWEISKKKRFVPFSGAIGLSWTVVYNWKICLQKYIYKIHIHIRVMFWTSTSSQPDCRGPLWSSFRSWSSRHVVYRDVF